MLLRVDNISKYYSQNGSLFGRKNKTVIDSLSFNIASGEAFGLVGESGSGKSTLARLVGGLELPDSGAIYLNNKPVSQRLHRQGIISIVFQDYTTSVNPTLTVGEIIAEPIRIMNSALTNQGTQQLIFSLLDRVGLAKSHYQRYIYELSGGQAQRVCLCRALASYPQFIVLDEALSSLDLPTQVQILDLLKSLKEEFQLSYLFISHDIQTVAYFCDKVMFFSQGKKIEQCNITELNQVTQDYSKQLLASVI
ncbi:ATP-binding component of an ABC superfamily nickel transporter [Proteus hauseri ATCC 700826]|uniref:ATP-binding component of an ABC superfamily nickel transporter n=1 Tax=Proteus hauseri ATCC 700826 TaxID=1354271 RepID=A0AAJ3LVJ6_PROHU|nr:dipeptide/oligopeptide/nickel ABC transporter ATP-binding protein [Proteus hauseri]OAT51095.1 ATP-binding component of an ABC superfamily nickel transporter [Proteus hauseri ATCC 700826]